VQADALRAARQRRSPAMILVAVERTHHGADQDRLDHALLAESGGEVLQVLLREAQAADFWGWAAGNDTGTALAARPLDRRALSPTSPISAARR